MSKAILEKGDDEVAVGIRVERAWIESEESGTEIDPAAVGAVSEAGELAGSEIDARAIGISAAGPTVVDPADVGAVSEAGKVSGSVDVHAEVRGGVVLVTGAVGRCAVAEIDPAAVGTVGEAGEEGGSHEDAVRGRGLIVAPVFPTDVCPVGKTVRAVDIALAQGGGDGKGGSEGKGGGESQLLHGVWRGEDSDVYPYPGKAKNSGLLGKKAAGRHRFRLFLGVDKPLEKAENLLLKGLVTVVEDLVDGLAHRGVVFAGPAFDERRLEALRIGRQPVLVNTEDGVTAVARVVDGVGPGEGDLRFGRGEGLGEGKLGILAKRSVRELIDPLAGCPRIGSGPVRGEKKSRLAVEVAVFDEEATVRATRRPQPGPPRPRPSRTAFPAGQTLPRR